MFVGARRVLLMSRPPFPKRLFMGRRGAWWDNQDRSTLFSDAARTTLAVVNGEVLGQTDKSGNGRHRTGSAGSGPILKQRSDGVYYLDYASGKTLSVPSSAALFNYLHDGTGGNIVSFLEWPQGASDTNYLLTGSSAAETGVLFFKSGVSESVTMTVFNGAASVGVAASSRFALSSPAKMLRVSFEGTALKASTDSSFAVTTSATTATPSTAAATRNLGNAASFNGYEYEVIVCSGSLAELQVQALYAYMKRADYPTPGTVDLTLLIGGQSNASGRGTVVTTAAEDKLVGVYNYTKAEEFRIATIPEHSVDNVPVPTSPTETASTPQHGFALRAAKSLKTNSSQDVLLVPCAVGSTSIAQWDTPLTKTDRSTLFGALKHRYERAAVKGGAPVIVWYGHEGSVGLVAPDFTNGGVGTTYQTAWASLVSNIRTEIVNAPVIFCQLSSDDVLATAAGYAAVGEAQRQAELSVANSFMVVTHDVARNASPDDVHVSRAGMDVIADRVALAIRQHLLGEAVNGTGPRIVGATYSGAVVTLTCDKAIEASATNYGDLFRVYAGGVEQTVSSAVRNADTTKIDITCSAPLVGAITLTYGYRAGAASAARTDFVMDSDSMPLPLFGPIVATA